MRIGRIEFADIGELSAATRQADIEMQLARGSKYHGGLLDLEMGDVGIQWGFHDQPMFGRGTVVADGAFLASWHGASSRANGVELGIGLVYYPPGAEHQAMTLGPMSWVSIRLSGLAGFAAALAPDLQLGAGSPMRYAARSRRALAAVRDVLWSARRAAESDGDVLLSAPARRAMREMLAAAAVRALAAERPERVRETIAGSSALVRRAEEVLRARGFFPVYLPELCAAVGASEARLQDAFRRVHGVTPTRYLRLRRLHLVRRALRSTRPEELTVSAAAAGFGFFELGRFAGDYRALFGELPSRTKRATWRPGPTAPEPRLADVGDDAA